MPNTLPKPAALGQAIFNPTNPEPVLIAAEGTVMMNFSRRPSKPNELFIALYVYESNSHVQIEIGWMIVDEQVFNAHTRNQQDNIAVMKWLHAEAFDKKAMALRTETPAPTTTPAPTVDALGQLMKAASDAGSGAIGAAAAARLQSSDRVEQAAEPPAQAQVDAMAAGLWTMFHDFNFCRPGNDVMHDDIVIVRVDAKWFIRKATVRTSLGISLTYNPPAKPYESFAQAVGIAFMIREADTQIWYSPTTDRDLFIQLD